MIGFDSEGKCLRWNELWSHSYFYDEQCEGCKFIIKIGKSKFCGKCEGAVTPHQVIRSQAGCLYCDNYTRKLNSAICERCLTDNPVTKPFELRRIEK